MSTRARRTLVVALAAALLVGGAWFGRTAIFTAIGSLLVIEEPPQRSDIAIMTDGSQLAGALEVADLYHQGMAPRVGVIEPPPTVAEEEATRRGIDVYNNRNTVIRLGVPSDRIVNIPAGSGTTGAVAAIVNWCRTNHVHHITLVTTGEHARRLRMAFRRAARGEGITEHIALTHFDEFRANTWWTDRDRLRTGLTELEKLMLDYVQHPL